ncbi:MAG: hypothetical protein ACFFBD_02985, partial [Candidatus Hodarchaeota archaeon]
FGSTVGFPYWVECILDMDVEGGNLRELAEIHLGRPIYHISQIKMVETPFRSSFRYPWNPFFPLWNQSSLFSGNALDSEFESKSLAMQPSNPQEIHGKVIFQGDYLELSLLYDENGTYYSQTQYQRITHLDVLLKNPLFYDMKKVSIDLEVIEKINNRVVRATDNTTTRIVIIASPEDQIPIQIGDFVQVNGTFTNDISNPEKDPAKMWQIVIEKSKGDSVVVLDN